MGYTAYRVGRWCVGVAEIKKSFNALPLDDRLRLLYDLWDELSVDATSFELSPEEQAELERRYAEHLAEPASSVAWEQVLHELRSAR